MSTLTQLQFVPLQEGWSALRGKRLLTVLLTLVRVPVVAAMALAYLAGNPLAATVLLLAFIVMDVLDGEFARRAHVETGLRRALDGVLDRLSVHLMLLLVLLQVPELWLLWALVAVRDLFQGAVALKGVTRLGASVAGAKWHSIYSLSTAVWGVSMMFVGAAAVPLGVVPLLIGACTAVDYAARVSGAIQRKR